MTVDAAIGTHGWPWHERLERAGRLAHVSIGPVSLVLLGVSTLCFVADTADEV
ncbi:MAG: hypothetical protein U0990_12375 [Candidatus Nanopelagicales bacterium]|nr:hypothetical protein [Candidatus Nanopelagicales bacterium]MDZ4250863.1 hypothetical protein [Candidatus Nanopelagicales bacterium]